MKVGFETASHMSMFSSFAEIVSAAFGGKKEDKPVTEDLSNASPEHFISRIAQLTSI